MEAVVFEDSPLAAYLEGKGVEDGEAVPDLEEHASTILSGLSFAPKGRPKISRRFRHKIPPPLRLYIPRNGAVAALHSTCSKALNSSLGRSDNARFLEHFRYIIIASQLLNLHTYFGQSSKINSDAATDTDVQQRPVTSTGAAVIASSAFSLVWLIHWIRSGGRPATGKGRMAILVAAISVAGLISYAYVRRQRLQQLRHEITLELSKFVVAAQELDNAAAGAMSLVQEVELVSRGYRISAPLPPISRLEERGQARRCARLRKQLRLCFAEIITRYNQACKILQPLTEDMDLEKYYDIYDITDVDASEAISGYSETDYNDAESVRALKVMAARYHTIRKIFLCCLMALDATGGKPDFARWRSADQEICGIFSVTVRLEYRLRKILDEEENFPVPSTPKIPLTPGHERWRAQLRQLNSLSSGIRGLQAKLHVLREESDRNINETGDISELGTNLMAQYESLGVDLKLLIKEWEQGKDVIASSVELKERHRSSLSGMLSPTSSLGGHTAVEEGFTIEVLKEFNGETRSRCSTEFSSSDVEEVFEAIAIPRQRANLSREERIAKMKDERTKKESLRSSKDANTRMLRELESVINMRPRGRMPQGRVTSI